MIPLNYPKDFKWGVSTSAYQIEGAADEDGKGQNIWDVFCKKEGATWQGHTGDIACDHYHRYKEDLHLLQELSVNAYRFSLNWTRLLPGGTGPVNPAGFDFYDRLIDNLLERNIEPIITLYHWDYPEQLFLRGGWLDHDSPSWFAEYTEKVVSRFADRVSTWFTMNEPQCIISLGLYEGVHAPGMQYSLSESLKAGHHLLLAHGRSARTIRELGGKGTRIGYSTANQVYVPASGAEADIRAAEKAMHGIYRKDLWNNSWWMDPVFLGRYPEQGLKMYGRDAPRIRSGDLEIIHQPLDYCGNNVYSANRVKADDKGEPVAVKKKEGYPITAQNDWEIVPESVYWTLKWMHERYRLPVMITENGHQNLDHVSLDGKVHDPQRIDYLHRHILQLKKAISEGIPVQGYFVWTLMDNFEWALGYKVRVGLVYTDFQTRQRIPKDSYHWYRDYIRRNIR